MDNIINEIFVRAQCLLTDNYPRIKFTIDSEKYIIESISVLFAIDFKGTYYEIKCTDKFILKLIFFLYYERCNIRRIYNEYSLDYLKLEVNT